MTLTTRIRRTLARLGGDTPDPKPDTTARFVNVLDGTDHLRSPELEQAFETPESHIADDRDRRALEACRETDWAETPIVDLVWRWPSADRMDFDPSEYYIVADPSLTVRRHTSPAPPVEQSAIDGARCEIQRVTRPLWRKIQREYEFSKK